jgi:hypothetical protein
MKKENPDFMKAKEVVADYQKEEADQIQAGQRC